MCCTRLAGNVGPKKSPKIRHLGTIAQLCRAISSQLRHVSTIRRKLAKQQYLLHMSPQYGELGPTSIWDPFVSLEHPIEFQRVSCLSFVTAPTSLAGSEPNFAQCLAISWPATVYIHFWRLLPHNGITPGTKFTLCRSLAFCYIGSITARHSSSGHQPNCSVEQTAPPIFDRAAITLGIGPHSSYSRPA